MKTVIEFDGVKVFHGSNLDVLPTLADNSIDSIVCDPPYELGFMGKKWDSSGIAYSVELWQQCLRVLKPGGHLLAFGGSRTWHRLAVAIEDAGFEVRDSIAWLYGSGFPKSMDISKAIDKSVGAEREVLGRNPNSRENATKDNTLYESGTVGKTDYITAPATDDAKKWEGWGTALKPAFEPVVVARKPLVGTVAENVLAFGTGGLNIDGSRIGNDQIKTSGGRKIAMTGDERTGAALGMYGESEALNSVHTGRWPANIILDEYTAGLLDEQAPATGAFAKVKSGHSGKSQGIYGDYAQRGDDGATFYGDGLGGASRFFYVAKANKRDRNEGLDGLPTTAVGSLNMRTDSHAERNGATTKPAQNFHPTVKPTDLMRYLVKLVTPPGGTVLDPFTGSGSTGKAAILEGFQFVGIELTDDYLPIIEGRLLHAKETKQATEKETLEAKDEQLF